MRLRLTNAIWQAGEVEMQKRKGRARLGADQPFLEGNQQAGFLGAAGADRH